MSSPRIQLNYVHSESMGYGRYGVKLAEAVARAGVKVDDAMDRDTLDPAQTVCWVSVPSHADGWFAGQNVTISTMWEATVLPEAFRESLHNFSRVIVPSEQNLELFSRYHDNVVKVPLGVDSGEWQFRARRMPGRDFVFLIGGSGARKGLDVAAAAFRRVFGKPGSWGSGPIPRIIFKSPRQDFAPTGERMETIGGRISAEAERDLYGMAHCYLQPSRGEGWGLQPLQAIAQGLPTILTDAHGQAEFAHLGWGIEATEAPASYFIYGDAGNWWEPSLDDLCDQMRWVYDNYATAVARAEVSSGIAHRDFNWDVCARNFLDAVGEENLGDYSGDRSWVIPEVKKYLVVTSRYHRCSVAGKDYQFQAGDPYYVVADVKRILFDAGNILDPACLGGDDTGLTDQQLVDLPEYLNASQYCTHCHQMLGSGVKRDFPE